MLLVEKASGIIADVIDKTVRGSREAGAQNRGPFGQNYRAESPATADPGAGERALEAPPAPVDAEGSGKKWWQIWK
ncbi:MAG: hypothetical protein HKO62_08480 [Gammaproteobacteria bacterium]|nr:hypothetical protein [Gammaproteobacteria bacterium]